MERITINTHNLPKDEDQISSFKASLGRALKKAPSDAHLCCCILRENETYVLNMRVHSASGHFPIHTQADDVASLIEKTTEKMTSQFEQWHKDPKKYAEDHKMGERPCFHKDGSVLTCPIGSYANKKFENESRT